MVDNMIIKILGLSIICVLDSFAGVVSGLKDPDMLEKTALQVKGAVAKNDISQVTARLRVEGAEFKTFNLFFPDTQLSMLLSTAERQTSADIRKIIERDLAITGGFKIMAGSGLAQKYDNEALLKQKGAEGISYLSLSFRGPVIRAAIEHKNFMTNQSAKYNFEGNTGQVRNFAHKLAQNIYENYIGPEDIFLRQIAAIRKINNTNQVVMLDFDGQNEVLISSGASPKLGPYFAPDGKTILYTIISNQGQKIVEQEIGAKNIQERTKRKGLNLDPRVLPDNSGILATLSLGRNANIYKTTRLGEVLEAVTKSSGRNLSPNISQDGKLLTFVSDGSGSPQIYEQILGANSPATRLTFQGRYNQTPVYSPDSNLIAFTGRDEAKVFDIFLLERSSKRVSRITQNQGRNQEPYFSPSGKYIIFSSERDGQNSELYLASLNGTHQYRLTNGGGYMSPVIRPGRLTR